MTVFILDWPNFISIYLRAETLPKFRLCHIEATNFSFSETLESGG
jgi:hypothetical protein